MEIDTISTSPLENESESLRLEPSPTTQLLRNSTDGPLATLMDVPVVGRLLPPSSLDSKRGFTLLSLLQLSGPRPETSTTPALLPMTPIWTRSATQSVARLLFSKTFPFARKLTILLPIYLPHQTSINPTMSTSEGSTPTLTALLSWTTCPEAHPSVPRNSKFAPSPTS
jgi:hypothetical protein